MNRLLIAGLGLAVSATAAQAVTVTPTSLNGWSAANVAGGATVAINGTYAPAGQTGALTFTGTGTSAKADYVKTWGVTAGRTLGNITQLGFDIYRDASSNGAAHLAPALRLFYANQTSPGVFQTGYLIWEGAYNDYPTTGPGVPEGQWLDQDILGDNFWMRAFGPSRTIENYETNLAEWAGGATSGTSHQLSAGTYIIGLQLGLGSGWAGTFNGAVDDVRVRFGASDSITADFEVTAVPEPATWATLILGFGLAGAALRRRRPAASLAA